VNSNIPNILRDHINRWLWDRLAPGFPVTIKLGSATLPTTTLTPDQAKAVCAYYNENGVRSPNTTWGNPRKKRVRASLRGDELYFEELDGEVPAPARTEEVWSEALKALRRAHYEATYVPLAAVVGRVEGKIEEDSFRRTVTKLLSRAFVDPSLGFAIIRPSTGEYLKECGGWTKDVAGAVFLKDFEEVSKRWVGWNRAVVVVRRSYFLEFSGHQFGPCRTRVMAEAHAVKLHTPDVEITTRITHP